VNLVVTLLARKDLEDAVAFIALDSPAAASRFQSQIETAAGRLLDFPGLGRAMPGCERRAYVVPRTRYVLIYRLARGTPTDTS
jgi:toxin ParE1/3/4